MPGHGCPGFSVVIPTYQRNEELSECLDRLAPYFNPLASHPLAASLEVIISDDGHDQELVLFLQQHYPWCRYISGPRRGPAANRNHGAHRATGDWLVFTDDDCLPQPGWIEAYSQNAEHCDVMEGRTSATGRRLRVDEECPVNEIGGYLWSCNFAIKRDLFLQLGGFNEDFPAPAMEDVEFRTRITSHQLTCQFVSDAVVLHPWRQRKGFAFTKAHSLSVGKYVSLHPEAAPQFSLSNQYMKTLRSLYQAISYSTRSNQYQGLLRQISLILYSNLTTWKAVRDAINHRA